MDFGNRGLFGLTTPGRYGGLEFSRADSWRVYEQLGANDLTLAVPVILHNTNGVLPILGFKQMVIALIVNSEGFPFSYETFDGNRADVSTMETILRMVERKYGKARRIWVFDRGIVSEENLVAIRKRGGQYLVGTPRSQMERFEAELLNQDNWT
jgi:hypothetical protein